MIYQDDLGRFSSGRMEAQAGNDKIEACMETKLLDLHQDKSCYILIGNKKTTEMLSNELELCPLTLYGKPMKRKISEKYLGDSIHQGGVADSVEATVKERCAKMFAAHKEIKAIVEDCRSTTLGGLKVGIDIWETAYIPSLLNNSSTWMEIKQSTIDKLEDLQNALYQSLLDVPHTTPKAALIWEVGGTKIKYRIMMNKLIFMNHIIHLEDDALAKQVQYAQQKYNVKGLSQEVEGFIKELELPNCMKEDVPQGRWKTLVKRAIAIANEKEIRFSAEKYKKMKSKVSEEEKFELKDYLQNLPLSQARTLFKHKYSMTENVKMNYKGDPGYEHSLWKCGKCLNQDTELHLLWCPGYKEFRQGLDLDSDRDLCSYLQKINQIRCKENLT